MEHLDHIVSDRQTGRVPAGEPILVPVDFSTCSRAALTFASDLSRHLHAPLLILHVIHAPGSDPGLYRKNGQMHVSRPIRDAAEEMLEEFVRDVCGDDVLTEVAPTPRLCLVDGLPGTRIQEIAAREQAALIVMGSHGRTGLTRLAMGSVSSEVAQGCSVPVTIVKAAPDGTNGEAVPVE